MFVRERASRPARQNAHIVDVLDAGVDSALEVPFIAMELLEGEPLDARIRRDGPVPHAIAADLLEPLGEALDQGTRRRVPPRSQAQNFPRARQEGSHDAQGRRLRHRQARRVGGCVVDACRTPAYAAPEQLGPSWRTIAEGAAR